MYPIITFEEFAAKYCELQDCEPTDLLMTLRQQKRVHYPNLEGWMLLQCQDLCSSFMGQLAILPFGPSNTYQTVPGHPISPRGLASDMSTVIAVCKELPE